MNERFAIQVSDRRLTTDGKLIDDEASKAFSFVTQEARLLVAFTGIARYRGFDTHKFLLQALSESGPPDYTAKGIIERVTRKLNEKFQKSPLRSAPAAAKRLTISFAGYNYSHVPPVGIAAEIGNRKDDDSIGDFRPLFFSVEPERGHHFTWIGAFGDGRAIDKIKEPHLREVLRSTVGADDVEQILAGRVRKVADDHRTQGGVGKQLDVIRLFQDPSEPILGNHLSMENKREALMPGVVTVLPSGASAICDIKIWTDGSTPLTYGRVHRNAPCPCGSGKRYRDCHRP